jgi:hypothetical protein
MYEAFDDFLRVRTWYTCHPNDEERFFRALDAVVDRPDFNPEELGIYIDRKRGNREAAQANLLEEAHRKARDYYVRSAWFVKKFLSVTGRTRLVCSKR